MRKAPVSQSKPAGRSSSRKATAAPKINFRVGGDLSAKASATAQSSERDPKMERKMRKSPRE